MAINTPPLSFILDFMEQRDVAGLLMKCNVVERGQDNTFSPLFIVFLKKNPVKDGALFVLTVE